MNTAARSRVWLSGLAVFSALLSGCALPPTNTNQVSVNTNTVTTAESTTPSTTNTTVDTVESNDEDEEAVDSGTVVNTTGVTWVAEPEQLADLGLLQNSYGNDHYYTVGTLSDGSSIIYMYREEMGKTINRFQTNVDGSYVLLGNHSEDYIVNDPAAYLSVNVTVDNETIYPELQHPATLTVNDLTLALYTYGLVSYSLLGDLDPVESAALEEFGSSPYGTIYTLNTAVSTTYNAGSIQAKKYLLVLADHSVVSYADQFDFLADDGSVQATWQDDYSFFADRQFMQGVIAGGCGVIGGIQYPVDLTADALTLVGTTATGDALYTIFSDGNSTVRNAYESYKVGRDFEGSTVELLPYSTFAGDVPLLLWQDAVGDYILFLDTDYAPAVECGKPVVYLYPPQTMAVAVQVGADMRISEPAYDNGWSVTASVDGKLQLADGTVYRSLYWEGVEWGGLLLGQ